MALSASQLSAWKSDIATNQSETSQYPGTQIKDLSLSNSDHCDAIAKWYNQTATPDFFVFRSDVPSSEIFDAVTWANYTPADAPDSTVTWSNRSLACQGKQFNLQILLQGQAAINAGKINIRSGINDATTNLPSGANGASRSGGWTSILTIMRRKANRIEKLFALQTSGVGVTPGDALGSTTNPGLMGYEGTVSYTDLV